MKKINKKQLNIINKCIDNMLSILEKSKSEKTSFASTLALIHKNINECVAHDYDGIEELSNYIYEDWRIVCQGKSGLSKWYYQSNNIDEKLSVNSVFEQEALKVDEVLETGYLLSREWTSIKKLNMLGKDNLNNPEWENVIKEIEEKGFRFTSPLETVPDDIWAYAKYLCIASPDEELSKWFEKEIPAFSYLSPVDIMTLEYGESTLKMLMLSMEI